MEKEIIIIENANELGAGTRGSSLGFDALQLAAIKFGKDLFKRYAVKKAPFDNSALYSEVINPHAKHIPDILRVNRESGRFIAAELNEGKLPVVISGDHSNAIASISAIKYKYPDKKLGVVWIDAHGDLHSPFTSPSGNMHGMPLGACLDFDNLKHKIHDPIKETVDQWVELKNLFGICPKILPEDLIFFSVRDTEIPENYLMEKHGIRNYMVDEIRYRGLKDCLEEANGLLKNCDLIYVSFDVDSMDCDLVSKGTGTPVSHGLTPQEAEDILKHYSKDDRLACIEVVEINPLLDNKGNKMAETTVRILDNLLRGIRNKGNK